jgi:Putative zinc-finger
MNCEETEAQLSAYLDGRLDEAHRRAVERHLASCSHCRAEAAALRRTIDSVSALPPVEPPPGFSQRVMAQVREEAQPSVPRRSFSLPLWPLWARIPLQAAAVLVIAGLAVYLYELNQPAPLLQAPAEAPSTHDEGVRSDRDRPISSLAVPAPRSQAEPARPEEAERFAPRHQVAPADALKESTAPAGVNTPAAAAGEKKESFSAVGREVALIAQAPFNDRDRFMHELSAIVRQVDGAILPPEKETAAAGKLEQRTTPASYTVWLVIPPDRYSELRGKLASLGTIEIASSDAVATENEASQPASPAPPGVAQSVQPPLRIKLTVHPPQPTTP